MSLPPFCAKVKDKQKMYNSPDHNVSVDKYPCTKCEEYMQKGVIVIETRDGETDNKNPYRTGKFFVITLDAAKRMNIDIEKYRCTFIEESDSKAMGFHESL